jgi:hypothetical protein
VSISLSILTMNAWCGQISEDTSCGESGQPLLRDVSLKESKDDAQATWFDLEYEKKVPHFCYYCGCLEWYMSSIKGAVSTVG